MDSPLWRALAEASGAQVLICDQALRLHAFNTAAAAELGLTGPDSTTLSLATVLPPETAETLSYLVSQVVSPEEPRTSEWFFAGRRKRLTIYRLPDAPGVAPRYLVVSVVAPGGPPPSDFVLTPQSSAARRFALGRLSDLSSRELEVLAYVGSGMDSKAIAAKLARSLRTVEHHRASIARKMRLDSGAGLVKFAVDSGVVAPGVLSNGSNL